MPCRPKFLPRLRRTMTLGRRTASSTTLGSLSASANSKNDSSMTIRSRSWSWSMKLTTARRLRKPPSGLFGLQMTATRVPRARDELDVLGRVQSEAVGLHEREHVDPLAGLHGLVGPATEGGDGDGEGLAHEQVVDPGDQFRGTVAHRDAARRELEQRAQLGRDRVGAARVVRDDLAQPPGQFIEHAGGGEVRVARDAEVDRADSIALAGQRSHRGAVRRSTAEQRGDVVGHGTSGLWVARAGEHGPPFHTEAEGCRSTRGD